MGKACGCCKLDMEAFGKVESCGTMHDQNLFTWFGEQTTLDHQICDAAKVDLQQFLSRLLGTRIVGVTDPGTILVIRIA